MRHCLSCDSPETPPDSFVDGLCEKCLARIERLRDYPGRPTGAARSAAIQPQIEPNAATRADVQVTPGASRTAGAPSFFLALLVMIGGLVVAAGALSFESRLGAAVLGGGLLFTLGFCALLSTIMSEATQPLREQNTEIIRLLKQIASQTAKPADPPIPTPADDATTNAPPNESPE